MNSARLRPSGPLALLLIATSLLGCDPGEPSDGGQYQVLADVRDRLGRGSPRVLVGSTFDLQLIAAPGIQLDEDSKALECVEVSASGTLTLLATGANGGRFEVSEAGPGAVEFAAPDLSCAGAEAIAELGPDRWSLVGVEAAGLRGAWVFGEEGVSLRWGMSPGPVTDFAPGFAAASETSLRVVADGAFSMVPVLLDPSGSTEHGPPEVRYNAHEAELELPARWAALALGTDSDGDPVPIPYLSGRVRLGENFSPRLQLPGLALDLPRVEAVAVSEVVSLELVPVYWPAESDQNHREWGPPVGVSAIARDAEGRRVYGGPIEWSVTRGRLWLDDSAEVTDHVPIGDCKASPRRPDWRGATVEATLGALTASTELEWVALSGDDTAPDHPQCSGSACDCSTAAPAGESGLASLALLALGFGLRRRRDAQS
jgi:MYXO-CTERM domain-containing protein